MQSHHPNHALRAGRKKLGLTQEELAEALGVAPKTIGRWERGETRPGDYECKRLCQILQQSEEELGLIDVPVEWNNSPDNVDKHIDSEDGDPGERTNDIKLLLASLHRRNAYLSPESPLKIRPNPEIPSHNGNSSTTQPLHITKRLGALLSLHRRPYSDRVDETSLSRRRILLQSGLVGSMALFSVIGLIHAVSESGTINLPLPHQRAWPIARYRLHKVVPIVRVLQWMLKVRSYDLGPTGVDGSFGPYTLNALYSFEKMSQLPEHDYVDNATWEKLIIPSAVDERGGQVLALQERLNAQGAVPALRPDGTFGPNTEKAVLAFQQDHQLAGTGQADLDTWCVLIGGHLS